jgi:hypothetical protein
MDEESKSECCSCFAFKLEANAKKHPSFGCFGI